jgi:hypothetical protein
MTPVCLAAWLGRLPAGEAGRVLGRSQDATGRIGDRSSVGDRETHRQQETARLAALTSTGILDTPPEPSYDAITRLAAEYFQADAAGSALRREPHLDQVELGHQVRELPRKNSIFDMVLAEDGPVVVSDISNILKSRAEPHFSGCWTQSFFASVPVRSFDGRSWGR